MENKLKNAEVGDLVRVFDYEADNYVRASVEEVCKDEVGDVYAVHIDRDYTDSEDWEGDYISGTFDNPDDYDLLKRPNNHYGLKVGDTVYVKDYGLPTEPYVEMKIEEMYDDFGVYIFLNEEFVDLFGFKSKQLDAVNDEYALKCDWESTPYNYEDDAISESYSEAASKGKTFADYTGTNITAESLGFESNVDKVIKTITPASFAFKESDHIAGMDSISDVVNHPSHYNRYEREVIDSIRGLCTPEEFRGYLKGNIIKYSARYPDKGGIQDIDKLAKYTHFLKEFEIEMEGE